MCGMYEPAFAKRISNVRLREISSSSVLRPEIRTAQPARSTTSTMSRKRKGKGKREKGKGRRKKRKRERREEKKKLNLVGGACGPVRIFFF